MIPGFLFSLPLGPAQYLHYFQSSILSSLMQYLAIPEFNKATFQAVQMMLTQWRVVDRLLQMYNSAFDIFLEMASVPSISHNRRIAYIMQ